MYRAMERIGLCVGTAAVSVAVVAGTAAAANAQSSSRVLVPDCNQLTYKPSSITITCGDGGMYVKDLHWHSWTTTKAIATATYVYDDCVPNCAQGGIHHYRADAELYLVHKGKKQDWFTRISLRFPHGGPHGKKATTYALAPY